MKKSPSSRRAWIEIACWSMTWSSFSVALLAEGVDRNPVMDNCYMDIYVALLAEGVDRNNSLSSLNAGTGVALLAEGVDRNKYRNTTKN